MRRYKEGKAKGKNPENSHQQETFKLEKRLERLDVTQEEPADCPVVHHLLAHHI